MIIDCICGLKKFEVNSDQIPSEGRQVKCGVCSKEWFYKPDTLNLNQPNDLPEEPKSAPSVRPEAIIPAETEELISAAEQDQKISLDFDDMPSKAEMDKNLDNLKAEREKNKKKPMSSSTRTRFLVYLLILLLLVLVVVSVPYKSTVLSIFPELEIVFNGVEPVYNLIFK